MEPSVRCVTANDGLEALTILQNDQNFQPDFIFLDLNMPRMTGIVCLKALRQLSRLEHVPIIIYTTSKADIHRQVTFSLGATYFYSKPTDIDELARALTNFFKVNLIN